MFKVHGPPKKVAAWTKPTIFVDLHSKKLSSGGPCSISSVRKYGGFVVLQSFELQTCTLPFWKSPINIFKNIESQKRGSPATVLNFLVNVGCFKA